MNFQPPDDEDPRDDDQREQAAQENYRPRMAADTPRLRVEPAPLPDYRESGKQKAQWKRERRGR